MEETKFQGISSHMSRGETAAVLFWLPIHVLLLPTLLLMLFPGLSDADLNFWVYAVGALLMVLLCLRFLRRDFETLCDRTGFVFFQVMFSYGLMLLGNLVVVQLLSMVLPPENPNNTAAVDLALESEGKIFAATALLAPILEELMFRAGIFGLLRRRSRALAYAVCVLLFGIYHVWQYALSDPLSWLYVLQYVPIGILLCRCYEKTETIWTSIFLHMTVNSISLWMLTLARELMS